MINILAIDFSTTNTGYAFRYNGKFIVGSVAGKGRSAIDKARYISEEIGKIVEEYNIQHYFIAIEEPIIRFKTKGNIALIRANGYFLSYMREVYNMGFVDVPNKKWCAYNLIKGNHDQRKEESKELLKSYNLVPEEEVNDDMSDAFGILLYMESQ